MRDFCRPSISEFFNNIDVKRTFPVASTDIEPGIGGHYSFSFGRR
jgi:hypothetical protein